MKVLSLTQPWASLVACSAKTIETRSWSTPYRGELAIHASKGFPVEYRALCDEEPFRSALIAAGIRTWSELPRGAIIATCTLTDCLPTDDWASWSGLYTIGDDEEAFGDYTEGRWAWILEDVRALPEPIPAKGSLGLWSYPAEGLLAGVVRG